MVVLRPFQMVSELLPETEVLNAADDTEGLAKLSFAFDLENHSIIKVFRRVLFLIKMRSKEIRRNAVMPLLRSKIINFAAFENRCHS